MKLLITLKGSAASGWYAPPKGTHSGEKHRAAGSGKAAKGRAKPGVVKVKPKAPKALGKSGVQAMGIDNAKRVLRDGTIKLRAVLPRGSKRGEAEANYEVIVEALAKHPFAVVDNVKDIVVAGKTGFVKEWVKSGGSPRYGRKVEAFYDPITAKVAVRSGFDKITFHHEIGHALWNTTSESARKAWRNTYKGDESFDRHTPYSWTGGYIEAFSESYMSYIATGGNVPKMLIPVPYTRTYNAVDDMLRGL